MKAPRRRVYFYGGIGLVVLLAAGAIALTGAGKPPENPAPGALPAPTESTQPAVIETLSPSDSFPPELSQALDEIESQVSQVRSLDRIFQVPRRLVSAAELRARMEAGLVQNFGPDTAGVEAALLDSLGLLPAGLDLHATRLDLASSRAFAYYDPEQKVIFITEAGTLNIPSRLNYAQEFTRALLDQHYNLRFGLKYNSRDCFKQFQRCSAVAALVDGDAAFTAGQWFNRFGSLTDREQLSALSASSSPENDSVPQYLQDDLAFPSTYGREYVNSLWKAGGWQAVNDAYAKPPVSSEQILHLESYPVDLPRRIQLPDLTPILGQDWVLLGEDSLGEWVLFQTLNAGSDPAARLKADQSRLAAAGWEGDSFALYQRQPPGSGLALVLVNQWDTVQDAREFMDAVTAYGSARWGKPVRSLPDLVEWQTSSQAVSATRNDAFTFWIISPQADLTASIAERIQNP